MDIISRMSSFETVLMQIYPLVPIYVLLTVCLDFCLDQFYGFRNECGNDRQTQNFDMRREMLKRIYLNPGTASLWITKLRGAIHPGVIVPACSRY